MAISIQGLTVFLSPFYGKVTQTHLGVTIGSMLFFSFLCPLHVKNIFLLRAHTYGKRIKKLKIIVCLLL